MALQFLDPFLMFEGSASEGDLVAMREPHFLLKKVKRKLNICIVPQNTGSSSMDNLLKLSKHLCLPRTLSLH